MTWKYCEEDQHSYADPVYVSVPSDVTGLTVVAEHGETKTGFARVELDSMVLIEARTFGKAPFGHDPLSSAPNTFTMPVNGATEPSGGCLALVPLAAGDVSGEEGQIHFVSRREDPISELIDLNLVVVSGVSVTETEVRQSMSVAHSLYTNQGAPGFGTVSVTQTTVVNPTMEFEGADVNQLRSLVLPGGGRAMNVFFISDVLGEGSGTLGWASGIPGPNGVEGTVGSGVIIAVDSHRRNDGTLDITMMGETIAHELGHQLGLRHTTERDGAVHDFLPDTPQCPASNDANGDMMLTADECAGQGGDYMMFWIAGIPQTQISSTQADVIYFSPVTR